MKNIVTTSDIQSLQVFGGKGKEGESFIITFLKMNIQSIVSECSKNKFVCIINMEKIGKTFLDHSKSASVHLFI